MTTKLLQQPNNWTNNLAPKVPLVIEGVKCDLSIQMGLVRFMPTWPRGRLDVLNTQDCSYLISAFGVWRPSSLSPSVWQGMVGMREPQLCSLTPLHHPCVRKLRRTRLAWPLPKGSVWLNQTDIAATCAAELLVFDCVQLHLHLHRRRIAYRLTCIEIILTSFWYMKVFCTCTFSTRSLL